MPDFEVVDINTRRVVRSQQAEIQRLQQRVFELENEAPRPAFTKRQLAAFLALMMCADPWPASSADRAEIEAFLEIEIPLHGFPNWIDAYLSLDALQEQGAP